MIGDRNVWCPPAVIHETLCTSANLPAAIDQAELSLCCVFDNRDGGADMPQDMHVETEVGHATPLKAVRLHCLSCCNGNANEVRLCPSAACPLWPFRHGHRPSAEDRATVAGRQVCPLERNLTGAKTALRAIRLRCIDCSGNSDAEARSCKFGPDHPAPCSLHPYRLGRNPNIARSDEWKQAAAERLALARMAALPKFPIETPHLLSERASEGDRGRRDCLEKNSPRSIGKTHEYSP